MSAFLASLFINLLRFLFTEKTSLLSRLFRRSSRTKQRQIETYSAQFPPAEWFNSKAVHLHSIGTQTSEHVRFSLIGLLVWMPQLMEYFFVFVGNSDCTHLVQFNILRRIRIESSFIDASTTTSPPFIQWIDICHLVAGLFTDSSPFASLFEWQPATIDALHTGHIDPIENTTYHTQQTHNKRTESTDRKEWRNLPKSQKTGHTGQSNNQRSSIPYAEQWTVQYGIGQNVHAHLGAIQHR